MKKIFQWSYIVPILAIVFYSIFSTSESFAVNSLATVVLIAGILAAVHHAEVVAHKVGEPYGSIILALAVTILETSIIVSLMLNKGPGADMYARDTLLAAVMLILNGILGLSMLVGAIKYKEQTFESRSVTIALVSLVSILILTLVLPNFTSSISGPSYSKPLLIAVASCCVLIYSVFLFTQTIRHRNYFKIRVIDSEKIVTKMESVLSLGFLLACLIIVVLLAKQLSPVIESGVEQAGLPTAIIGVAVAFIILLPESIAAIRAAYRNEFQTSINLSLGSALAGIGLSIPTVVIVAIIMDLPLVLGINMKSIILLGLSIFTVMLSLNKGRTNSLYAVVLLVNLVMYVLTIIFD